MFKSSKLALCISIFSFLLSLHDGFSQNIGDYTISKIALIGNQKTTEKTILRELPFSEGDTIKSTDFEEKLMKAKQNLNNTALFNFIFIDTITSDRSHTEILISLKERWYLWPNPIFEISERNFNSWLENRNFNRVSYGAYLVKNNFRGRRENLQILVRLGYSEKYGFTYSIPYITKKQNFGLAISFGYSRNHEIQYGSKNNQQEFFKDPDKYVRTEMGARLKMTYRPEIYSNYGAEIRYSKAKINDTILFLNKDYFFESKNSIDFFSLNFQYRFDKRDNRAYPLHGFLFTCDATQIGLKIRKPNNNSYQIEIHNSNFWQLHKRVFFAESVKFKISPRNTPYYLQKGLGFSDYVRGFEVFLIDGQGFGLFKSNLKYQLIKPHIQKIPLLPLEKFNTFHYAFYVNLFADAGYVVDNKWTENNLLGNKIIYSSGIGIDFVSYYDLVFRVEGTWNSLKQIGLFLHLVAPI